MDFNPAKLLESFVLAPAEQRAMKLVPEQLAPAGILLINAVMGAILMNIGYAVYSQFDNLSVREWSTGFGFNGSEFWNSLSNPYLDFDTIGFDITSLGMATLVGALTFGARKVLAGGGGGGGGGHH